MARRRNLFVSSVQNLGGVPTGARHCHASARGTPRGLVSTASGPRTIVAQLRTRPRGGPDSWNSPDFFILFFRGAQCGLSLEWRRCCSALLAPPRPALSRSVAPTAITPSPRGASEVHPRSSAGSTSARTAGGGALGRCPTGEAGGAVPGRSGSTARSRSEVHRRAPCTRRRRRMKSATEACPRRSSTTS